MDEWRKWLKHWVSRFPRGSTPWPGWPASRLTLVLVQPGELFIAIRGPRHDGHGFVAGALAGARRPGWWRATAHRNTHPKFAAKLFVVDDTLDGAATPGLARLRSVAEGETGTKDRAAWQGRSERPPQKKFWRRSLGARFRVLKTQGNLNNEYGLPLTLLRLERRARRGGGGDGDVASRGAGAAGADCAPDVGVVTRVAVEHLEFFASIDEIALAERELIENLAWPQRDGGAERGRRARGAILRKWRAGAVIWFGAAPRAEFRAENIEERGVEGSAFDFVSPARTRAPRIAVDRAAQRDERAWRRWLRRAFGALARKKRGACFRRL